MRFSILLLLPALLLPACGEGEKERRQAPDRPGISLRLRLGPGVRARYGPGRYTLRGWGPWMAPVGWSHVFRLARGEEEARLRIEGFDRNLRWLSLERGGRIVAGAELEGALAEVPSLLEVREIELESRAVAPRVGELKVLPAPRWQGEASPFGCGLALARGSRAVIRPLLSPQMNLRSRWVMPWRDGAGRYAVVIADSTTGPSVWEGAEAEWDLDGEAPRRLPAPQPYARLSTAGFVHRPLPRPPGGWGPLGIDRFRAFAPGWEVESRQGGALLIGHADWGRFAALVPAVGDGFEALPLWPTAEVEVLGKEKEPVLLWAIAWAGRRRARVEVLPLGRAGFAAARYGERHWSFLNISAAGGMGAGFTCGGVPLRVHCTGGGRPLVILETPMLEGARSGGLVFWPRGAEAELRWGTKGSSPFTHRGRKRVAPGGLEGVEATTPD